MPCATLPRPGGVGCHDNVGQVGVGGQERCAVPAFNKSQPPSQVGLESSVQPNGGLASWGVTCSVEQVQHATEGCWGGTWSGEKGPNILPRDSSFWRYSSITFGCCAAMGILFVAERRGVRLGWPIRKPFEMPRMIYQALARPGCKASVPTERQ